MAGDEEKGKEDAKTDDNTKEDEDAVKEPGCCFHYGQCIFNTFKKIYYCIFKTIESILEGLSYCWYPSKERMYEVCECCGKRME